MKCRDKDYLVTVDYYSNFWEIDYVENTLSSTIIDYVENTLSSTIINKFLFVSTTCFTSPYEILHL
jgi:hypothetical protein